MKGQNIRVKSVKPRGQRAQVKPLQCINSGVKTVSFDFHFKSITKSHALKSVTPTRQKPASKPALKLRVVPQVLAVTLTI